jgi:hypothetical protein
LAVGPGWRWGRVGGCFTLHQDVFGVTAAPLPHTRRARLRLFSCKRSVLMHKLWPGWSIEV